MCLFLQKETVGNKAFVRGYMLLLTPEVKKCFWFTASTLNELLSLQRPLQLWKCNLRKVLSFKSKSNENVT